MQTLATTLVLAVGALGMSYGVSGEPAVDRFEYTGLEMAVPIKIVLYAADKAAADAAARAALDRIRQLNAILSDYDSNSELRRLCNTAGQAKAQPVGDDLWRVLAQAQAMAERTDGAFDVTVGPVVRLWRRAQRREELPTEDRLAEYRQLVGYRLVKLDTKKHTVKLLRAGMRLDLGGIAKGYAVDEALAVIRRRGIPTALVDAGGDVALGDPPPDKPGWLIGVASLEPDAQPSRYLWLSRAAIATSGDSWQYVEIDGVRYSHIVDPRTGIGLTDHSVVTVIAPNCITADGLASAVSVLGPTAGLRLIDDTPLAAAFILRAPKGNVETHESSRWRQFPVARPRVE